MIAPSIKCSLFLFEPRIDSAASCLLSQTLIKRLITTAASVQLPRSQHPHILSGQRCYGNIAELTSYYTSVLPNQTSILLSECLCGCDEANAAHRRQTNTEDELIADGQCWSSRLPVAPLKLPDNFKNAFYEFFPRWIPQVIPRDFQSNLRSLSDEGFLPSTCHPRQQMRTCVRYVSRDNVHMQSVAEEQTGPICSSGDFTDNQSPLCQTSRLCPQEVKTHPDQFCWIV